MSAKPLGQYELRQGLTDILLRNKSTMLATDAEWLIDQFGALSQRCRAQGRVIEHLMAKMGAQPELWYLLGGSAMVHSRTEELMAEAGVDLDAWRRGMGTRLESDTARQLARHGVRLLEHAHKILGDEALDQLSVSDLPVSVL